MSVWSMSALRDVLGNLHFWKYVNKMSERMRGGGNKER